MPCSRSMSSASRSKQIGSHEAQRLAFVGDLGADRERHAAERFVDADGVAGFGRLRRQHRRVRRDAAAQHDQDRRLGPGERILAGLERDRPRDGRQADQLRRGRAREQRARLQQQDAIDGLQARRPPCARAPARCSPCMHGVPARRAAPIDQQAEDALRDLDVLRQQRQELLGGQRQRDRRSTARIVARCGTALEHGFEAEHARRVAISRVVARAVSTVTRPSSRNCSDSAGRPAS